MTEEALEHSRETRHLLNNHIQITQYKLESLEKAGEERHDVLTGMVTRLESALKWAGGLLISLILTVLGWSLLQQVNANESQKKDVQQQLDLMKAAEIQRLAGLAQPRAAETPLPANRGSGVNK
jgi:hypothetical protein